jgi:hypothetical protein
MLKKTLLAVAAAGLMAVSFSSANAAEGCGAGFHRGPHGACRPNVGPGPAVVIEPGGPRVGVFYRGRGWWDGHRYWAHRYAWHHGWRYR